MYPNVTITGTDYAYDPASFAALVAGNQVPTLFEVYLTDPSQMIDQGIATDLTSFIKDQKLDSVFNPSILNIAEKDGKYYGIPRFAYAMGLAYNIKMLKAAGFDSAPTTWDQLATMAQKLTDRNAGVAGFSFITDGTGAAGWHLTTLAYNFGLKNDQIVTQSGSKYTENFATGPLLDTLNYIHDLRWKYDVLPLENLAWDTNGAALANGTAAMVVMAGDQFTWLRQTYPDAPIADFGFAPLPAGCFFGRW
jgi:ABC-type glycerol-3-phosphate transport system substrate-binding protein